jgi:hypothetical protein
MNSRILKRIEADSKYYRSAEEQIVEYLSLAQALIHDTYPHTTKESSLVKSLEVIINKITKSNVSLELVNSEGPVLTAIRKSDGKFSIIDQWTNEVGVFTKIEFMSFLLGETRLTDSSGTRYCYPDLSIHGKANAKQIIAFIND